MPTIPEYQSNTSLSTGGFRRAGIVAPQSPKDPGQQILKAASGLIEQKIKIEQDEVKRASDAFIAEKSALIMKARNNAVFNPDDGVMSMKGKSAAGAGKYWQPKLDVLKSKVRAEANGDYQKEMLEKVIQKNQQSFDNVLVQHLSGEMHKYEVNSYKAVINESINSVGGDVSQLGGALEDVIAAAEKKAMVTGGNKKDITAKDVSRLHVAAFSSIIRQGDHEAANQFFKKNEKSFFLKDKDVALKLKSVSDLRYKSRAIADNIVAKGLPLGESLELVAKEADPLVRAETRKLVIQDSKDEQLAFKDSEDSVWRQARAFQKANPGKQMDAVIWAKLSVQNRKRITVADNQRTPSELLAKFYALAEDPNKLSKLSAERLDMDYLSRMSKEDADKAQKTWLESRGPSNPTKYANAQLNDDIKLRMKHFKFAQTVGGIKTNTKQSELFVSIRSEVSRLIEVERINNKNIEPTQTKIREIIDSVVDDKVLYDTNWWFIDKEVHRLSVKEEDKHRIRGNVEADTDDEEEILMVPLDKIPDASYLKYGKEAKAQGLTLNARTRYIEKKYFEEIKRKRSMNAIR